MPPERLGPRLPRAPDLPLQPRLRPLPPPAPPRPPPARRKLSRLALRRAVLSLAATAGPALLLVLEWWLHEG
ncbi:hypothetical protein [Streptomyces koyangensis]|uniref:Uncharacterized protein n=1 Tax=Streptomyces koyangensis TaxID=188770 RepID=A0ABX7E8N0_9ACTN|nr:hypothetical protein [Streptomyces koyangensis]QRF00724.1 hypothetical protein G9U55_17800 [Streptomyces koyangensis]